MLGRTNVMNPKIELEEIAISPGASNVIKNAEDGKGFSKVTVPGDADLIAANIREGIDIFGILGTLKEGIDPAMFGCTEYAIDEVIYSSKTNSSGVAHSLGKVPEVAIISAQSEAAEKQCIIRACSFKNTAQQDQYSLYHKWNSALAKETTYSYMAGFTSNQVSFGSDGSSGVYYKAGVKYILITMA